MSGLWDAAAAGRLHLAFRHAGGAVLWSMGERLSLSSENAVLHGKMGLTAAGVERVGANKEG